MDGNTAVIFGSVIGGVLSAGAGVVLDYSRERRKECRALCLLKARQEKIDVLWKLRGKGIELRNQNIQTGKFQELATWKQNYMAWREETLNEAEKISVNLRGWLEWLDTTRNPPGNMAPFIQNEIEGRNMSEMLARLGEFLKGEIQGQRVEE